MTKINFDNIGEKKQEKIAVEMLVRNTIVALAADPKSHESFYLIKITEEKTEDMKNRIRHLIKNGMTPLDGVFLKRKFNPDNLYTPSKKSKSAFFFRESVLFLSLQFESEKRHFELTNDELLIIIKYVALLNQTSLF